MAAHSRLHRRTWRALGKYWQCWQTGAALLRRIPRALHPAHPRQTPWFSTNRVVVVLRPLLQDSDPLAIAAASSRCAAPAAILAGTAPIPTPLVTTAFPTALVDRGGPRTGNLPKATSWPRHLSLLRPMAADTRPPPTPSSGCPLQQTSRHLRQTRGHSPQPRPRPRTSSINNNTNHHAINDITLWSYRNGQPRQIWRTACL